ncbi:MAG: hypothetical protein ACTSO9_03505 [Candidatus Helarchaeota archaeon]
MKKMEKVEKNDLNKKIKFFIHFSIIFAITISILIGVTVFILFSFIEWIKIGIVLMVYMAYLHTIY